MDERLIKFEQMLTAVQDNYIRTTEKMEQLRQAGREKSATFRQLMGDKLMYQNILNLYKIYGLMDNDTGKP